MSSRHPVLALSKVQPEKYAEAVNFLRGIIRVFQTIKIGRRADWKPIQTGVILSTCSVLDIAEELLDTGNKFLLTSRLTQDCLENLFSLVRIRKPVPTPLEFKYALKMIRTAQFFTLPRTGSYEEDEGEFLADYFNHEPILPSDSTATDINFLDDNDQELSVVEQDSLYNLIGYCIHSIRNTEKTCEKCLQEVTASPTSTHYSPKMILS